MDPPASSLVADPVGQHWAALSGQVVGDGGAPLGGALVTTDPRGFEASTDSGGNFSFSWLPAGTYEVVAAAEGLEPVRSAPVTVAAGEEGEVSLTLDTPVGEGGLVQVWVTGADGLPLVGALVEVGGASAQTDKQGYAALTGVEGEVDLRVSDPAGLHIDRTLEDLELSLAGGLQWEVRLSGRAPEGADYVGSASCAYCHEEIGERHAGTRHADALVDLRYDALPGDLAAFFDAGEAIALGRGRAIPGWDGDQPVVTLEDAERETQRWPVDLLLGSPAGASALLTTSGGRSWPLPVGWRAAAPDREGYPDAEAALVPYQLDRWFDGGGVFLSGGAPDDTRSADNQCLGCHVTGFELSLDGDAAVLDGPASERWVEAGVSCERCHGPGSDHRSAAPGEHPFTITNPAWLDPARADEVCGQCHSRVEGDGGLPYPWTEAGGHYLPGDALGDFAVTAAVHWPGGAAAEPRMQLDEQRLSAHGDAGDAPMRCVDCHGPHGSEQRHDLLLAGEDNTLCLSCHQGLSFGGDEDAARDHTGHGYYKPDGVTESGRCTSCHMAPTAADLAFSETSGAGDLSSHRFAFLSPEETLEVFGGAAQLAAGEYPLHGCGECHGLNNYWWQDLGLEFPGVFGDPSLPATHEAYLDALEDMYP